jgi:hypothetical protein
MDQQSFLLPFHNLIRQLVPTGRSPGKMRSEHFTSFLDRFDDCVAEFPVLKMRAHSIDKPLPELFAAFFMNGFIAHHGKLMRAGRDENEHGIALARFVHTESIKFFLRSNQWIDTQLAPLNINPNLTGGFRFRFPNRPNDSLVFEPTEKFLRSHLATSSNLPRRHQNCRRRR